MRAPPSPCFRYRRAEFRCGWASWGSAAGLRRVARLGDGWLASAYNTDPQTFSTALTRLGGEFPHALVTMWTWITDREADAERMRTEVLAPFLHRDPA